MEQRELLSRIRAAVITEDPGARILLYGSRARGDAQPDSDWDLLILLRVPASWERQQAISRRLYEIEWETGEVLSIIFHSQEEWDRPPLSTTPLHGSIRREGMVL